MLLHDLVLPAVLALSALLGWKCWRIVVRLYCNPLRRLPGPESASVLFGFAWRFWTADPTETHEQWTSIYGRTISYRVIFDMCLFTVDTKALKHILLHDFVYQKPPLARSVVQEMLGTGAQSSLKRRIRYILTHPAFGPFQIREFTDLFLSKAEQLRDILSLEVTKQGGVAKMDMYNWMHRIALDIIGEAAFGCSIDSLNVEQKPNALCDAFRLVSQSVTRMSLFPMLRFFFPVLRVLPEEQSRRFVKARETMSDFARKRLKEKREELQYSISGKPIRRRRGDFLSLIVEANVGTSPPDRYRLSEEASIDGNFLVAGHETTSSMLSWLFYALARHPLVQEKVRRELFSIPTERPTIEELNSLPYLDAVLREAVRLHPPVPSTVRFAKQDDLLPLGEPVYIGGQTHDHVFVPSGTPVIIPILAINRDRALWGADAFEFRPERWECLPEAVTSIPGIWAHTLTFMGGPRACLGYRFAVNEMKVAAFTLLRSFEFELGASLEDVGVSATLLGRPMLISEPQRGPQLPLLVKAHKQE
ncbi:cytochrome P450 [Pilatotrama ljubarskyi]|nr:cytochrome P450 [Pilatotrama ljubarskyi]